MTAADRWLLVLSLAFAHLFALSSSVDLRGFTSCTNKKAWKCLYHQLDEPPSFERMAAKPSPEMGPHPPKMYATYLNKPNPLNGELYVSARIKIELLQASLENATALVLQIVPAKNSSLSPVFYEAALHQRAKEIPPNYTVDFVFTVEDELAYDQNYTLKLDLLPVDLRVYGETKLWFPPYELPPINCSSPEVESEFRQKQTIRWASTFKDFTFHTRSREVNVSFYGAPSNYCIDSYEIQVKREGLLELGSWVILSSEMGQVGGVLVGTINLPKFENGMDYTVHIRPFSSLHPCVCRIRNSCGCTTVQSSPFSFKHTSSEDDTSSPVPSYVTVEPVEPWKLSYDQLAFIVIILCVFCLVVVTISLVLLLVRYSHRPTLIFLKTMASVEKSLLGLPDDDHSPTTVLLLNAEPRKRKLVGLLADLLERNGNGLTVLEFGRETAAIERNLQFWCHDALRQADKIVLFHSNRAACLLSSRFDCPEIDVHDPVFQKVMSLMNFADHRLVHACWDNNPVSVFGHVETRFSLPKNIAALFDALGTSKPSGDHRAEFEKLYNRLVEENEVDRSADVEQTPVPIPQTTTPSTRMIVAEITREEDIEEAEGSRTEDSGLITMDEIERRKFDDTRSIGRSEDSGVIV